jgi:hypothetical protein
LGGFVIDGHTVVAIRKQPLYDEDVFQASWLTTHPGLTAFTIQPAVNFDDVPSEGPAWFVAKGPPEHTSPYKGGAVFYRRLQWNATGADWVDTAWQPLGDPPQPATYRDYYDLDDGGVTAPQAGGPDVIDLGYSGASRLMMAVIRDNALWTCHHIGLIGTSGSYNPQAGPVDRSAIQWVKMQITGSSPPLAYGTSGRIWDRVAATGPFCYYMPSLMVNSVGDMVVGFSGSSVTSYISAFYSWRLAGGLTAQAPILIHSGEAYYEGGDGRWGDYSYTSLDPIDGLTFWTVQEYALAGGGGGFFWGTWIARIKPVP